MKKLILVLTLGLALAGCADAPAPPPAPLKLGYSGLGKIVLATSDLRVIDRSYGLLRQGANVGYMFKPTLADAVNRWAADRLQASGSTGHATLIIKDASVTREALPVNEKGIENWFTRHQGSQYVGRVEINIDAQGVDGSTGLASASAVHAVTLPEDPSEAEKYDAYAKLLSALMVDLNRSFEQAAHEHLGRFLLPPTQ